MLVPYKSAKLAGRLHSVYLSTPCLVRMEVEVERQAWYKSILLCCVYGHRTHM